MRLWLIATAVVLIWFGLIFALIDSLWVLFVVLCLVVVLLWLALRGRGLSDTRRWSEARRKRALGRRYPTLRTLLFRVVLVSFVVLLAAVLGLQWVGKRQQEQESYFFSSQDEAKAELQLAYHGQPTQRPSDVPVESDLYIDGTGLWVDAEAYQKITAVIDKMNQGGGNSGTFLLSGRDMVPGKIMLPPSVYNEWKSGRNGARVSIPSTSFPTELLKLPEEFTLSQQREAMQVWLDYIEEHGSKTGWAIDQYDGERIQYALWRTGPGTGYYVVHRPREQQQIAWYWSLFGFGWQALTTYVLLAPLAGLVAWYLARRIARPVAQVAGASTALADGDRPGPIPEQGPQELATMAQSFNRMSERLAEAEAAQKTFVASVGHELKTPLTAIDGYAELLSDGAVDPKQAGDVLGVESARLRRLVDDLLDLARIDRSEFSVRDEDVDLAMTAGEVMGRYQALAADHRVMLRVDAPTPILVRGDRGRVLQVASNLVENAIRVSHDGGEVVITARPGLLEVSDAGPGLTADDLDHAFERFYLHRKYGGAEIGTGLGLAIVKELVDAMGGAVDVTSSLGSGTTFRITMRPADSESEPT